MIKNHEQSRINTKKFENFHALKNINTFLVLKNHTMIFYTLNLIDLIVPKKSIRFLRVADKIYTRKIQTEFLRDQNISFDILYTIKKYIKVNEFLKILKNSYLNFCTQKLNYNFECLLSHSQQAAGHVKILKILSMIKIN